MSSTQVPVFLHLLADRALRPAAVRLEFSGTAEAAHDALVSLAEQPEFSTLAVKFPCLVALKQAEQWSDLTWITLQQAGCKGVDESAVFRSDALLKPVLPAPALWLEGDWMLAAPAKPNGSQSASRALALKLVQLVVADADTRDIEDVFRQDPTLSYHLLRLVNSLGMGATRRITSFSQAILILGRQQLRRWLNLMLFSARTDDHRAPMLLACVTLRARCLELLAKQAGMDKSDQELAFMAGMFSLLGVLFGLPLPEVLKPLQVSETLVAAVLRHEGEIGRLLHLVERTEQRDLPAVSALLAEVQINAAEFNLINLQACQWMTGIVCENQGAGHE